MRLLVTAFEKELHYLLLYFHIFFIYSVGVSINIIALSSLMSACLQCLL